MLLHKMIVIRLGMHEHMHIMQANTIGSLVHILTQKQWCMVMLSSCLA